MNSSDLNPNSLGQLHITAGKMAGQYYPANTFPLTIGRGKDCDLQMTDSGIWEQHLEIDVDREYRLLVHCNPEATAMINGEPLIETQNLRNGDQIEIGTGKVQFWLGNVRQKNLHNHETIMWVLLGILTLSEIALILWLG
ncbi:MAG: FHA domain-containing protein [Verrucomicrobiota bacterium]|nr:FHA domain-containing protein [Verrucomicrobiota bacterium]